MNFKLIEEDIKRCIKEVNKDVKRNYPEKLYPNFAKGIKEILDKHFGFETGAKKNENN